MIGTWNIRGLNNLTKQRAVSDWISKFSLGLVGLLEIKVEYLHLDSVVSKICLSWRYLSNTIPLITCRVLVCWNLSLYHINNIQTSLQELICEVTKVLDRSNFYVTFMYDSSNLGN